MVAMNVGGLRWKIETHERGLVAHTPRWSLAIFRSMKDGKIRRSLRRRARTYSRREVSRLRRLP